MVNSFGKATRSPAVMTDEGQFRLHGNSKKVSNKSAARCKQGEMLGELHQKTPHCMTHA